MIVVKVCMWPEGDRSRERLLSLAAIDCIGVASVDIPAQGIVKGERAYRVRLFKDTDYGGPKEGQNLEAASVWRTGYVRGHMPGPRGVWDLLGGALKLVLGDRLSDYKGR